MNNYKSKSWVLLTGCLGGIGQAIINELKIDGKYYILGLDIEKNPSEELKKNIDDYIFCDLANTDNIFDQVENIFDKHKYIYHLINNAGIMRNDPVMQLIWNKKNYQKLINDWNTITNINLRACFALSACFTNNLFKNRLDGSIVHISSIASSGNAGQSSYSSSKGGLRSLSKTLSKELGPIGIRSNVIIPGFIETISGSKALSEKKLKKSINKTPLKRLGKPSEVGQVTKILLENKFLNGCEINIDGGLTL